MDDFLFRPKGKGKFKQRFISQNRINHDQNVPFSFLVDRLEVMTRQIIYFIECGQTQFKKNDFAF